MTRGIILTATVVCLTVATGLIHGNWTNRFGHTADRRAAAEKLESLPTTPLGDWDMVSAEKMDQGTLKTLACAGYVNRVYKHRVTGEQVHVAVMIGPPQPMVVHTPEICYSSRDYPVKEKRQRTRFVSADGVEDVIWKTGFESRKFASNRFFVYYGWSTGANWLAESSSARYRYAWHSYLYKLQIAGSPAPILTSAEADDPCHRFLKVFLPEIKKVLQPQSDD